MLTVNLFLFILDAPFALPGKMRGGDNDAYLAKTPSNITYTTKVICIYSCLLEIKFSFYNEILLVKFRYTKKNKCSIFAYTFLNVYGIILVSLGGEMGRLLKYCQIITDAFYCRTVLS